MVAPVSTAEQNADWFTHQNLAEYVGMWVAVVDRRVVAKARDLKEVLAVARANAPGTVPFIASVPEESVTV